MHKMHDVLGIYMILNGVWLIGNDVLFVWPPVLTGVLNDDIWGGLFIFLGVGILMWAHGSERTVRGNRLLLTASAGLMAFLTVLQAITWAATGELNYWVASAAITAFIITMSRGSDTRDE